MRFRTSAGRARSTMAGIAVAMTTTFTSPAPAGGQPALAVTEPARASTQHAPIVTEFPVTPGSGPTFLAAGPGGSVWFTEPTGNRIGRIHKGGKLTEFPIPTPGSDPLGIAAGVGKTVWFAEGATDRLARMPATSE